MKPSSNQECRQTRGVCLKLVEKVVGCPLWAAQMKVDYFVPHTNMMGMKSLQLSSCFHNIFLNIILSTLNSAN